MAPQGWGHVLRHPSQAGLGLKEEEPAEWHRLVGRLQRLWGRVLHRYKIQAGIPLYFQVESQYLGPIDGSSSWQPRSDPPSPPSAGTKIRST